MSKKVLISIGVVVLVGGAFVGWRIYAGNSSPSLREFKTDAVAHGVTNGPEQGVTVITLTKEGFVPDTVTIPKGTTIMFKNKTGNLFWPASNLHPSHLLYPEFDPQTPISPTDTWSYTFEKVGEWKFHDHLSPYFTGVITVTE